MTPARNYALIAHRRAARLSQRYLAAAAGCIHVSIHRYERGATPNFLQAESIAQALGVDVDEVFEETIGPGVTR